MTSKVFKQVTAVIVGKNAEIDKLNAKRQKAITDLNALASGMLLGQLDNGQVYSMILKIKNGLDA